MDRAAEAARLAAIRRRVAALDGAEWLLGAAGDGMQVDARWPDGAAATILTFTAQAGADEMQVAADALADLRFLLGLLDRAIAALRPPAPPVETGRERGGREPDHTPDHTTEAAMLCADPAFKRWLMDCHGLGSPATDDRAAQKLRGLLGVTSRREINRDEAVRARWIALRSEFRAWKRRAA